MASPIVKVGPHAVVRAGSLCLIAGAGTALAGVQIEPQISIGITRTDNVMLEPENGQSETVYSLLPGFDLVQESPRVSSTANYQMEAYLYDNLGEDEIYNRFEGQTRIELDPDNFFFEATANRTQSIRDPRLNIPRSNLPLSNNRVDRDELSIGPSLNYPLGPAVSVTASFRRTWVRYDESALDQLISFAEDSDSDTYLVAFDNYRREEGVTWAVRYSQQETDYGVFLPWEYRQATVELGGWVRPGLRLFAAGGKESAWDEPFDPSLEDTFWEAGISKSVGEKFFAEVAAGERTFGRSRRGALEITLPHGRTSFSYLEEPTTQERNPFLRGGLFDRDMPEDFLNQAGLPQRYISKRMQWDLTLELRRTELGFEVFDETRDQRALVDGTPLDDVEQTGGIFDVSWRLGARTGLRLEGSRVSRTYQFSDEVDLISASVGANYSVGPRTQASLTFTYTEEDARDRLVADDYTERSISFLLTRTF